MPYADREQKREYDRARRRRIKELAALGLREDTARRQSATDGAQLRATRDALVAEGFTEDEANRFIRGELSTDDAVEATFRGIE